MTDDTTDRTGRREATSRRSVLKGAAAMGAASVAGLTAYGSVGAQTGDEPLVVNDFTTSNYPEENALGNWVGAHGFVSVTKSSAALRLSYEDGGFFATRVDQDVSAYDTLELEISGLEGGEEEDVQLEVGGVEGPLTDFTDDAIERSFSTLSVDLTDLDVDRSSVDDVRLNFWQGGSGTVELQTVAFGTAGGGEPTPTPTEPRTPRQDAWPWEVEAGNEKEPENPVPLADVSADTSVAELCPNFDDRENSHLYIDRSLGEYIPGSATDPGDVDVTETNLSDEEKAGLYDVDLDALSSGHRDGSVTLGDLGTQTLDHVTTYLENGFPYHATAKLLPRIMLLPDETETQTYHKGGNPWDETVEAAASVNDPDQLIQYEWPTDARSYVPDEKYERDRAHDQPDHEDGWTNGTPGEEVYADEDHPLLDAIEEHPITGEDLTGGFTSNAPMEARIKMHSDSGDYWYQVLDFKNTQEVPYYIDAAIIWWVGPSSLSTLRNGHYNNTHRPQTGYGHPQRDIIEVIYDRDRSLSAYAIRIAQHDEPYRMRTAYPNQWWGLEQGGPASDPINGGDRYTSSEERQDVVDTMWNTLHIEIASELDRNNELHDTLQLRNRVSN